MPVTSSRPVLPSWPRPAALVLALISAHGVEAQEPARAGVELYLCGQSMMSRGLPREGLAKPVQVALSAMTAMELLQARGHRTVN